VRSTIKAFREQTVDFLAKAVRPSVFFAAFFFAMKKKAG